MESEALQVLAAYGALALSVIVTVERFISRGQNDIREKVEGLTERLSGVQSFQDKYKGADILTRVKDVEERQRTDETSLVRVEQRLHAIESLLTQLTDDIRQMDT